MSEPIEVGSVVRYKGVASRVLAIERKRFGPGLSLILSYGKKVDPSQVELVPPGTDEAKRGGFRFVEERPRDWVNENAFSYELWFDRPLSSEERLALIP